MRFMIFVPGNEESEAGVMPSEELFAEMGKFNQSMADAGIMLAAEGLAPTSKGAKVRFDGKTRTVIDGPFTEAKELVAGFWIIEVGSKEEAIEWIKKAPFDGGVEIEIRQIFGPEDLGDTFTPELREQEEHLRTQIADKQ